MISTDDLIREAMAEKRKKMFKPKSAVVINKYNVINEDISFDFIFNMVKEHNKIVSNRNILFRVIGSVDNALITEIMKNGDMVI